MNLRIYVYLTDTSTDVWPSSSCCLLTLAVVLPTPVATLQWERSRVQCQVYTSKEEGFYKARRVLDPYNTVLERKLLRVADRPPRQDPDRDGKRHRQPLHTCWWLRLCFTCPASTHTYVRASRPNSLPGSVVGAVGVSLAVRLVVGIIISAEDELGEGVGGSTTTQLLPLKESEVDTPVLRPC